MKILLAVHHPLDPGAGAAGATWHVGQAMAALGHEIDFFSWDDLSAALPARGKELLFPEFAARRFAQARREDFDVIDASTGDAWLWARLRPGGKPLLVTRSHGLEHRYSRARRQHALSSGRSRGVLERLYHDRYRLREVAASLAGSDVTLFLNQADRDEAVGRLSVDPGNAYVIANGVADHLLGQPPPEPDPGTAVTLAQLGTFDPRKGSDTLLEALAEVLPARPATRMLMLGTGTPEAVVLSGLPQALHDQVEVVPRYEREELPDLLNGAEILLHPSLAEGFSLALVEGMACGLAPVATTVGAAPDLLGEDGPGLLVSPGDSRSLAAAILTLIDDPPLRQRLRVAAHELAQRYTWRAAAEKTIAAYESGLQHVRHC